MIRELLPRYGNRVVLRLNIAPVIALCDRTLFCKREMFLGDSLVIPKGRELHGEERSGTVFSSRRIHIRHFLHMLLYFREKRVIVGLGILLVQNAILFIAHADTAEEI